MARQAVRKPKYRRFAPLPTKCPHCGGTKPVKLKARNSPNRRAKCIKCGESIRLRAPQAFVDIAGKRRWLGAFGSATSKQKYAQLIAAKEARETGEIPDREPQAAGAELTINELLYHYLKWARNYYADRTGEPDANGQFPPGPSWPNIKAAVRRLKERFGMERVSEFGPLALKKLRQTMAEEFKVQQNRPIQAQVDQVHRLRSAGESIASFRADRANSSSHPRHRQRNVRWASAEGETLAQPH